MNKNQNATRSTAIAPRKKKNAAPLSKVCLSQQFARFNDYWSPKVAGDLNGQQIKLAKFYGEFPWHHHAREDEMFLVVRGSFRMDYRDAAGVRRSLQIGEGEFVIIPRGMEHRPCARSEAHVLLFEPAGTLNTGHKQNRHTVRNLERL
jgi:mannose-6-phosphate isomerase-like protein (cupin superfamily)